MLSFKLKQTLRKNYFGGKKNESLPILFKVICCASYHGAAVCPNVNHGVNYGMRT